MKTISALLLGLSVSLLLNSTATAESFNDRDQHYPTPVTSNAQDIGMSGDVKPSRYEGLYDDVPWSLLAPAGSQGAREPAVVQSGGFNR